MNTTDKIKNIWDRFGKQSNIIQPPSNEWGRQIYAPGWDYGKWTTTYEVKYHNFEFYSLDDIFLFKTVSDKVDIGKFTGYFIKDHNHYNYFKDGITHRNNGPALIERGFQTWYYNGECYSIEVKEFLENNKMNWRDMTKDEFNMMWTCIL